MKKYLIYIFLFLAFTAKSQIGSRWLGPTTKVANLDTISTDRVLTADPITKELKFALMSNTGTTDFQRYDRLTDFPNPGNADVLYYADLENLFYKWQDGSQTYGKIPGNDFTITNILTTTADFRELVNNNTIKNRFAIDAENFIKVSDIAVKGYTNPIDLTTFDYSNYDIFTVEIQQGTPGQRYLLIRKSKFPFLDTPGKTYQGPFIGGEIAPALSTKYLAKFYVTTNKINLTGLDPDFYCFENNGSSFFPDVSITAQGISNVYLNLIDYEVVGSGSETITSLVDNGNSFTYTNEAGTVTTVNIPDVNGTGNPDITVARQLADITQAGPNAFVEVQDTISLVADFIIPSGQTWYYSTGLVDAGTHNLDYNGAKIKFNGKQKGLDLFSATTSGKAEFLNDIVYASNIGAVDDSLKTTDNFNVGLELLKISRINKKVVWNKQDKGVYYRSMYIDDYGSPFYNVGPANDKLWIIGSDLGGEENKINNIHVEIEGDVELRPIENNLRRSSMFLFYNTEKSKLSGGTLRGDRFEHDYDQEIEVNLAATSSGNVRLRILEHPDYQDNVTENEINVLIPITLSDLATNRQEVVDYINTNITGYNAIFPGIGESGDPNNITLQGPAGQFFTPFFTDETSGASLSTDVGPYEWGHGVIFGSNANGCIIEDIIITEFHGDGIASKYQGNGTPAINDEDMSQGNILSDGTIDGADTSKYYLTDLRNLPTQHLHFSLAPNAENAMDLLYDRYWVAFYDDSGNFIEKSLQLKTYTTYPSKPEWKQYRIIVDNNGATFTNFNYFMNSKSYAFGAQINNVTLDRNRRHGATNLPIGFKMSGGYVTNNGGVQPEGGFNLEDDHKHKISWEVEGTTFQNNTEFDIILKGTTYGTIKNCFFPNNTWETKNVADDKPTAISTTYARDLVIDNNYFDQRSVSIDIGVSFTNNKLHNTDVSAKAGGSIIADNTLKGNSRIIDGTPTAQISLSPAGYTKSIVRDNDFYITESWGNASFFDESNTLDFVDNNIRFNDRASLHSNIADESLRLLELNDTGSDYQRSQRTTTNSPLYTGTHTGTNITGIKAAANVLHKVGWSFYASDLTNVKLPTSLKIENGFEKSFTIDGLQTEGWLWLVLNEYPNDGVGEFETITIENGKIQVPERIDANEGYLNNSNYGGTQLQNLLRVTQDKNVNLVFKNMTFDNKDGGAGLFMYLGHRGTTVFDDCDFSSVVPETIDFNNTGSEKTPNVYASANTGAITFKSNCNYDNITIVGRSGVDLIESAGGGTSYTFNQGLTENAGTVSLGGTITDSNYQELLFEGGSGLYLYDGVDASGLGLYIDKVDASSSSILMEATDGTLRGINRARLSAGSGSFATGKGFYSDASFPTRLVTDAVRATTAVVGQVPVLTEMTDTNGVGNVEFQNVVHDIQAGTNVTIDKSNPFEPIINVSSSSFNGGTITNDLILDNGTNSPPELRLRNTYNSDNYELDIDIVNGIGYFYFDRVSDGAAQGVRVKASAWDPWSDNAMRIGSNSLRLSELHSVELFASTIDLGGDNSGFVKDGGGIDTNTYQQVKAPSVYNANRNLITFDLFKVIYSNSTDPIFTIDDEITRGWQAGQWFEILNTSDLNTITINANIGQGVTFNPPGNITLSSSGQSVKLIYNGGDEWLVIQ